MKAIASAPGKIILTGEHFVVYDEPALVMAINRYVWVSAEDRSDIEIYISTSLGVSGSFNGEMFKPEIGGEDAKKILEPIKISAEAVLKNLNVKRGLNIEVSSTLPIAVGLGSSGASAVATVAAVGKLLGANLNKKSIIDLSTEAERYVHSNPSGVDQTISTYGGVASYKKGRRIMHLKVLSPIPIVIGNSGVDRNTGKLVNGVKLKVEKFPNVFKPLINAAGKLTIKAIDALKHEDLETLGQLMDVDHGLLTSIGVSSEILDKLVYAARRGGALGAKLTGGGGGGCMVALSNLDKRDAVAKAISDAGGTPIIAEKVDRGVRSWIVK